MKVEREATEKVLNDRQSSLFNTNCDCLKLC